MHTIFVIDCYDSEVMAELLLLWDNVELARRKIEKFNMSLVTYFNHISKGFTFQYKYLFAVKVN